MNGYVLYIHVEGTMSSHLMVCDSSSFDIGAAAELDCLGSANLDATPRNSGVSFDPKTLGKVSKKLMSLIIDSSGTCLRAGYI